MIIVASFLCSRSPSQLYVSFYKCDPEHEIFESYKSYIELKRKAYSRSLQIPMLIFQELRKLIKSIWSDSIITKVEGWDLKIKPMIRKRCESAEWETTCTLLPYRFLAIPYLRAWYKSTFHAMSLVRFNSNPI